MGASLQTPKLATLDTANYRVDIVRLNSQVVLAGTDSLLLIRPRSLE